MIVTDTSVPIKRLQILAARNELVVHAAFRQCKPVADRIAEVILAVLISTFTFELTEKHVYWNMATVQYPSTDPRGALPELPLKVGLVTHDSVRA